MAHLPPGALAVPRRADFFTAEVWTRRGFVTYYTVFVIELQSRRIQLVSGARHPYEAFVLQAMRHFTDGA